MIFLEGLLTYQTRYLGVQGRCSGPEYIAGKMQSTPHPIRGLSKVYPQFIFQGSAEAWWLMPRTPDSEVGGSSPTRVKPCCVLEKGTSTPQKYW